MPKNKPELDDWFAREEIESDLLNVVAAIKMPVRVQKNGKPTFEIVERSFREDLAINMIDLEEQMMDAPSIYAFWSSLLSEQQMITAALERKVKIRRAAVKRELKAEAAKLAVSGGGLSTRSGLNRDDIDDLMADDSEIQDLEGDLIKARRTEGKLWGIVNAMKMKAETMSSLAGFKKQEYEDAKYTR